MSGFYFGVYGYRVGYDDVTRSVDLSRISYDEIRYRSYYSKDTNWFDHKFRLLTSQSAGILDVVRGSNYDLYLVRFKSGNYDFYLCSDDPLIKLKSDGFYTGDTDYGIFRNYLYVRDLEIYNKIFVYFMLNDNDLFRFIFNNIGESLGDELLNGKLV